MFKPVENLENFKFSRNYLRSRWSDPTPCVRPVAFRAPLAFKTITILATPDDGESSSQLESAIQHQDHYQQIQNSQHYSEQQYIISYADADLRASRVQSLKAENALKKAQQRFVVENSCFGRFLGYLSWPGRWVRKMFFGIDPTKDELYCYICERPLCFKQNYN